MGAGILPGLGFSDILMDQIHGCSHSLSRGLVCINRYLPTVIRGGGCTGQPRNEIAASGTHIV